MSLAQNRMKQHADKLRSERELVVSDSVFLKLHPYKQCSMAKRPAHKLSPKFYGPFKILERIGKVAYHLDLPATSKIHPIFHVSLLKLRIGDTVPTSQTLPRYTENGTNEWQPEQVLDMQVVRHKGKTITQWLIKWEGMPGEDSTWESARAIQHRFPSFASRGRSATQGGGTC
ncbi:hypothetical protein ACLB2K_050868 [Fragaria x ananassa]